EGNGPADADYPRVRSLPAIAAASHPVVRVRKRDAPDAVFACQRDRPRHRRVGVEIAGAAPAVPSFQSLEGGDACWFRTDVDHAVLDRPEEAREAIDTVGIHAVSVCLGEQAGTQTGAVRIKSSVN